MDGVNCGARTQDLIRKGQLTINGADAMSFADQFYALAGMVRPVCEALCRFGEIPLCDQPRDKTQYSVGANALMRPNPPGLITRARLIKSIPT